MPSITFILSKATKCLVQLKNVQPTSFLLFFKPLKHILPSSPWTVNNTILNTANISKKNNNSDEVLLLFFLRFLEGPLNSEEARDRTTATALGRLYHSGMVQGKVCCQFWVLWKGKSKDQELVWWHWQLFFWFPVAGACLELESTFSTVPKFVEQDNFALPSWLWWWPVQLFNFKHVMLGFASKSCMHCDAAWPILLHTSGLS